MRYAITDFLSVVNPAKRVNYLSDLLNDPVRAVRINTARIVLDTPARLLSQEQQQAIQNVLDEYVAVLKCRHRSGEGLHYPMLWSVVIN